MAGSQPAGRPRVRYLLGLGVGGAAIIFGVVVVPVLVMSMVFTALALYGLSRSFPLLYGLVE
jgi:hypothetical protein